METLAATRTITNSQGDIVDFCATYVPVDSPAGRRARNGETITVATTNGLTTTWRINA
jgi:hypothetical protein